MLNGITVPYVDSAGKVTICYGYVPRNKSELKKGYTPAECNAILDRTIEEYMVVLKGLPVLELSAYIGFLDFAYNAGITGANGSGVKRCLKKSDYVCASKAVLDWKYISRDRITSIDKKRGVWKYNSKNKRYYYDCSQYVGSKPNKVCYGLWERRKIESKLLSGTIKGKDNIEHFIKSQGKI